jgi:hypothetical protein
MPPLTCSEVFIPLLQEPIDMTVEPLSYRLSCYLILRDFQEAAEDLPSINLQAELQTPNSGAVERLKVS